MGVMQLVGEAFKKEFNKIDTNKPVLFFIANYQLISVGYLIPQYQVPTEISNQEKKF